jgi:hypothetical protein
MLAVTEVTRAFIQHAIFGKLVANGNTNAASLMYLQGVRKCE